VKEVKRCKCSSGQCRFSYGVFIDNIKREGRSQSRSVIYSTARCESNLLPHKLTTNTAWSKMFYYCRPTLEFECRWHDDQGTEITERGVGCGCGKRVSTSPGTALRRRLCYLPKFSFEFKSSNRLWVFFSVFFSQFKCLFYLEADEFSLLKCTILTSDLVW